MSFKKQKIFLNSQPKLYQLRQLWLRQWKCHKFENVFSKISSWLKTVPQPQPYQQYVLVTFRTLIWKREIGYIWDSCPGKIRIFDHQDIGSNKQYSMVIFCFKIYWTASSERTQISKNDIKKQKRNWTTALIQRRYLIPDPLLIKKYSLFYFWGLNENAKE